MALPTPAPEVVTDPAATLSGPQYRLLQRQAHQGRMASAVGRGVAHELRNVAQLICMLRDAMQHEIQAPPALRDAVTLADATLMRQIGTLERLPPVAAHALPVALTDVVERATELIRRQRRGAKMTFVVEVPRTLPPVLTIETDLDQVLWELLTNAREAAEARGYGTVHLRAEATDEEVILTVEDDGPGISPALHATLFDAFVTSRRTEEHAGIGLTMARQLIEENGGELTADLAVASGARLVIRLPMFRRGRSGAYAILV